MIYKSFLIIFVIFTLVNCANKSVTPVDSRLKLLDSIELKIKEPSGITLNYEKTKLWIVGDNDTLVYLTDLKGKIIDSFPVEYKDLEGITIIKDSLIGIIDEVTREIILYTIDGKFVKLIQTGLTGDPKHGLEGITFIPDENILIAANQKNPELFLKVDLNGNIISVEPVNFGDDIADLYYDNQNKVLWILSKESNTIFKCNLNLDIITKYLIPNKDFEGIVVNNNMMYLVSDMENKLYKYEIIRE